MRDEISARYGLSALVEGILASGHRLALDGSFYEQIAGLVDQESHVATTPEELVRRVHHPARAKLLDFGCGTGAYRPMLEGFGYDWHGVNYRAGMAVQAADAAERSADPRMAFYDGLHLPYPDQHFGVVYSFQTFEHIQSIPVTFAEIARVLAPGGALVGAMSYLEQIHDYSTFNFTPYGLKLACAQAGLDLVKVYPRFDAFTYLLRRLLVVTSGSDDNSLTAELQAENAVGRAFIAFGERLGLGVVQTNLLRLMFSAHFTFHIIRPG